MGRVLAVDVAVAVDVDPLVVSGRLRVELLGAACAASVLVVHVLAQRFSDVIPYARLRNVETFGY